MFDKSRTYFSDPQHKKLLFLFVIIAIVLTIPATVFIAQQQQTIRQRAAEIDSPSSLQSDGSKKELFVPGEILVKYKTTASLLRVKPDALSRGFDLEKKAVSISDIEENTLSSGLKAINQKYKIKTLEKVFRQLEGRSGKFDFSKLYKLQVESTSSIQQAIQDLKKDPQVEYAEPNYIVKAQAVPNDPYYPQMWGLSKIQVDKAWDITKGSNSVIVAVLDTGIDYTHPDLGACLGPTCRIIGEHDFAYNDNDPMDGNGHGTHVAGTIGALVNNNIGISGISWDIKLMAVKVLDDSGYGTTDDIVNGIGYATDSGAKVINMSLGGGYPCSASQAIQNLISYANFRGVTVVVAAGNSSNDAMNFTPASCDEVITVAATGPTDERSYYSNYGSIVDISAPGGDKTKCSDSSSCLINSTNPGSQYKFLQGTSMATPHVAGVAALLLAKDPTLIPRQIENILENSAFDLGDSGFDTYYGFGQIDANKALLEMNTKPTLKPHIDLPTNLKINSPLEITGTAEGNDFSSYVLEYATEDNPTNWQTQGITLGNNGTVSVTKGALGKWNLPQLQGKKVYFLRLTINTASGEKASVVKRLIYDPKVKSGWPFLMDKFLGYIYDPIIPTISDLDGDGKKEIIFFNMSLGYILNANAEIYPGWNPYKIRDYKGDKMLYPPITVDFDSSNAGKEIALGYFKSFGEIDSYDFGLGVRGAATQTSSSPILFDRVLRGYYRGHIYSSLTTLKELDNTTSFILSALNRNVQEIWKLNKKGEAVAGWPIVPFSPKGDILSPARILVSNVINAKDQNIVVSYGKPEGKIVVLDVNGALVNQWSVEGHHNTNVLLGDVDGNGIQEIITDGLSINNIVEINIFKGDGTKLATFDTKSPDRAGFIPADFNNDGKIDIFVDNNHGSLTIIDGTGKIIAQGNDPYPLERPYIYLNNDFEINNPNRYGIDIEYYDAVVADLNGDGKKDIIKQGKTLDNKFGYYFYTVDGSQIKTDSFPSLPLNKEIFSPISIADVDNDGKVEIIFIDDYDIDFALYAIQTNITFTTLDWPQYLHDEHHTGTGYIDTPSPTTPTPSPTPTPIPFVCNACAADVVKDGTGKVNKADVDLVAACFGKAATGSCTVADINKDGIVNVHDITCANSQNGKTCAVNITPTPTPTACTACGADIDGNGTVNGVDLNQVTKCFGKQATGTCVVADINKDGVVSIHDITCVSANYNKKCIK